MTRRRIAVVGVAGVVLVVAALFGRWEGDRAAREQERGMRQVLILVTPLDNPALTRYRRQPTYDCLLYRVGENPFALEVCFDHEGRLIETIDRRGSGDPRYWSLRYDFEASHTRVDPAEVLRLIERLGPPRGS